MADMKNCTEKTRQWPNALADVPSDEMDDFLTHAEACPYHTEILRAEDEELRAVFRQARGFDSHGHLLLGDELQATIAEHERRLKIWQETLKEEPTFSNISLYNGDRKIASCGMFFDLTKHESLHELDPQAGLQIRGIRGGDVDEDVLLGCYALVGVRHNDDEQFLELDNGYTVGLKVRPSEERTFMVQFRCVETSVLEEERADASTTPKTMARSGNAPGSSFSLINSQEHASTNPMPLESSGWFPPPPTSWPAGTMCALAVLVITFLISDSLVKSLGQVIGAPAPHSNSNQMVAGVQDASPTPTPVNDEGNPPPTVPPRRRTPFQRKIPRSPSGKRQKDALMPATAQTLERLLVAHEWGRQAPASGNEASSSASLAEAKHARGDTTVQYYKIWQIRAMSTCLSANNHTITHFGTDEALKEKLLKVNPGQELDIFVVPAGSRKQSSRQSGFNVVWDVTRQAEKIVQLRAIVHRSDNNKVTGDYTFNVEEDSSHGLEGALAIEILRLYRLINPSWQPQIPPAGESNGGGTTSLQQIQVLHGSFGSSSVPPNYNDDNDAHPNIEEPVSNLSDGQAGNSNVLH
jgi:hypothetical protein